VKVRQILLCKVNVPVGRKRGIYGAHVDLYPLMFRADCGFCSEVEGICNLDCIQTLYMKRII